MSSNKYYFWQFSLCTAHQVGWLTKNESPRDSLEGVEINKTRMENRLVKRKLLHLCHSYLTELHMKRSYPNSVFLSHSLLGCSKWPFSSSIAGSFCSSQATWLSAVSYWRGLGGGCRKYLAAAVYPTLPSHLGRLSWNVRSQTWWAVVSISTQELIESKCWLPFCLHP